MPGIDPNVAYFLLVMGLWVGISAMYIPGTGVAEILAIAALAASAFMLTTLPTNWIAVLILVVGVLSFIVIPFLKTQWALVAVVGLALQAVGALLLFNGLFVSPLLIALTVGVPLLYHTYVLMPIFRRTHKQPVVNEDDLLIGARGRALTALNPTGTVYVRGETWSATSDRPLEPGDEVVVLERDGLQIYVEGAKHKRIPENGYAELPE